jgi:hypothetical protein
VWHLTTNLRDQWVSGAGESTSAGGCLLHLLPASSSTDSSRAACFLPPTSDEIISMNFSASWQATGT